MLPNTQTEGNAQEPTGAAEQPTSPASGAPEGQPLPDYVTALQGQVAELASLVKGVQKGTDKQIGQVRGDIKRILELKDKGLDETGIQRELFLDSLMTGQTQSAPAQAPAGSGQPQGAGLDVDAVVKSLQFQPNDPALAALKIKHGSNAQAFLQAAADLRLSQLTSPTPTPGTALSQTGNAATGLTDEQVAEKGMLLEQLYKNYSRNRPQIETILKELDAAGVTRRRPGT